MKHLSLPHLIAPLLLFPAILISNIGSSQYQSVNTGLTREVVDHKTIVIGDFAYILTSAGNFSRLNLAENEDGMGTVLSDLDTTFYTDRMFQAVWGDFIYVGYRLQWVSKFYRYSISGDDWEILPALPNSPSNLGNSTSHVCFNTENYLYVNTSNQSTTEGFMHRYNFLTGIWDSVDDPYYAHTLVGYMSDQTGKGRIIDEFHDVWEYDEPSDTWTKIFNNTNTTEYGTTSANKNEIIVENDTMYHQNGSLLIREFFSAHSYNLTGIPDVSDLWFYGGHLYFANATNGQVFRVDRGCYSTASAVLPSGPYYRNSFISLPTEADIVPAINADEFDYYWYLDGEPFTPYNGSKLTFNFNVTETSHELVFQSVSPYCEISDTTSINLIDGAWNPIVNLPSESSSRWGALAFPLNGNVYFGFGCVLPYVGASVTDTSIWYSRDMWKMNLTTKEFVQLPDAPMGKRAGSCYATYEGKGYMLGGMKGSSNSFHKDFWCFDPTDESWTQLPDFPQASGIANGMCFISNGKLYAGLGHMNTIYKFDFASQEWTSAGTLGNDARYRPIVFTINDETYVGLGTPYFGNLDFTVHTLYKFNAENGLWLTVNNNFLPGYNEFGAWAIPFEDHVLIGGNNTPGEKYYVYYPESNTTKEGPIPSCDSYGDGCEFQRRFQTSFQYNGRSYLAFGVVTGDSDYDRSNSKTIFEFRSENCGVGARLGNELEESPIGINTWITGPQFINNDAALISTDYVIGNYYYPDGEQLVVPEPGDYSCLMIRNFESCRDTFHFDHRYVCKISKDSLSRIQSSKTLDPCMWVYNDEVYVGAGVAGGGVLRKYTISTNTWTILSPFPFATRSQCASFQIGNKLYLCGGVEASPFSDSGTMFNELWEYDISTNTWTEKAPYPGGSRRAQFGYSYNNLGYVGCGIKFGNNYAYDVYAYNSISDSWTEQEDYNVAPEGHGVVNATVTLKGDTAIFIGGCWDWPQNYFRTDITAFNHQTSQWFTLGTGITQIEEVVDDIVSYADGNERAIQMPVICRGDQIFVCHNNYIFMYNIATDTWSYQSRLSNNVSCVYAEFEHCDVVTAGVEWEDELFVFTVYDDVVFTQSKNFLRRLFTEDSNCLQSLQVMASILSSSSAICNGQEVTLSSANQDENYDYSWKLNGNVIANASDAEYTTTVPGEYQLIISSGMEVVYSEIFELNAYEAPIYETTESILPLCEDGVAELIASNSEGFNFQWYLNGVPIDQTDGVLNVTLVGYYDVEVADVPEVCNASSLEWQVIDFPCGCAGDFNEDGFVNIDDLAMLLSAFGCIGSCAPDMDGNQQVDTYDFMSFIAQYGNTCSE